jgi:hypothetical protein
MIQFDPPLTVTVNNKAISVSELPLVIIDVSKTRVCKAQAAPFYKTVNLWTGGDYDAIGDYTQEQAEARYLEVLGDDPAAELAKLYFEPPTRSN